MACLHENMKKSFKLISLFIGVFVILALILGLGLDQVYAKKSKLLNNDSYVTSIQAELLDNTPGVTTDLEVTFTVSKKIEEGTTFNLYSASCAAEDWQDCDADFSKVSLELPEGMEGDVHEGGSGFILWGEREYQGSKKKNKKKLANITKGEYTITVKDIKFPKSKVAYVLSAQTEHCEEGVEECNPPETESNTIYLGAPSVTGTVTDYKGNPVEGAWVEVRTKKSWGLPGSSTDSSGGYVIFDLTAGKTYFLRLHVQEDVSDLVAPDEYKFKYKGTEKNIDLQFNKATKEIKVKAVYADNGAPLKDAHVNAFQHDGGGETNKELKNGEATLAVGPGTWEININPSWEGDEQAAVDWSYQQKSKNVTFADNDNEEVKSVTLKAERATARVKGSVVKADGSALTRGGVEIRDTNGHGSGYGLNQKGNFNIAVVPGTYKLHVYPDSQQYYLDPIKFTIGAEETKDFENLKLQEKNFKVRGNIKGLSVQDEEETGIEVHAWKKHGDGWGNAEVDVNGNYELYLSPGKWEVGVDTHGTNYIFTGEPRKVNAKSQGSTKANFKVELADAQVNLEAYYPNGERAVDLHHAGAFCRDREKGWGAEYHSHFENGTANINLKGGKTYECGMHLDDDEYSANKAKEVKVKKGQNKNVNIKLAKNDAEARIILKDQTGKKVTEKEIEVFVVDQDHNWRRAEYKNDAYYAQVQGDKKYAAGYWIEPESDLPYLNEHQEDQFKLIEEKDMRNFILTINKSNATIKGKVLDPDGDPIKHAWIGASNEMFMEDDFQGDFEGGKVIDTGTETLEDGSFELPIVAGKFEVFSGLPPEMDKYLAPKMKIVNLKAGDTKEVVLQFRKSDATLNLEVSGVDQIEAYQGFCWAYSDDKGFAGSEMMSKNVAVPLTTGVWFVGCDYYNDAKDKFYRSNEKVVSISKAGDYSESIKLKEESFDIPEGMTFRFNADQQMSQKLPDGTELIIPANAMGSEGEVTVLAEPEWNLYQSDDAKLLNFAWNFEALDADKQLIEEFNKDVTIKIPYDEELLAEKGLTEKDLMLKYLNEENSVWNNVNFTLDTENDFLIAQVNHFTDFAVVQTGAASDGASAKNIVVTPEANGGPQVAVYDKDGNLLGQWFAFDSNARTGIKSVVADLDADARDEVIAYPAQEGWGPQLRVFDQAGNLQTQFFAYETGFTKGIQVVAADLDGEGEAEIITIPEDAPADVKVFDRNGNLLSRFNAFPGVEDNYLLAAMDMTGDGTGELVITREDYSDVKVFDRDGNQITPTFSAFSKGADEMRLADLNGDGNVEIIMMPVDGSPHLRIMDHQGVELGQFFAYDQNATIDLQLYTGDLDGDGNLELITMPASKGTAQVRVFDLAGQMITQFYAFPENVIAQGFEMLVADVDNDAMDEMVVVAGEGQGSTVRVLDKDGNVASQFNGLHEAFKGGLNLEGISQ